MSETRKPVIVSAELGAEDYIKKPVSKEVIITRVRRVLERRKK